MQRLDTVLSPTPRAFRKVVPGMFRSFPFRWWFVATPSPIDFRPQRSARNMTQTHSSRFKNISSRMTSLLQEFFVDRLAREILGMAKSLDFHPRIDKTSERIFFRKTS